MSNIAVLQAEKREGAGKGVARALRREGKIPAIVYGGKEPETRIATPLKELSLQYLRGGFQSKLIDLEIGGKKLRVIPRAVQLDPVTDVPVHADFMRVNDDTKVHVFVKVKFLGNDVCPGLKRGGVLNIIRRQVELICRADSIPSVLEVDLSELNIGESVHSHSISYPAGVSPAITTRDFTIAAIVGRAAAETADASAEAAPAEGAAPAAPAAK
ncbi:MAG: large subunit ribosomal protein [Rickettsiaceae bacterium]|jgi:large subunit ribosomal protein L25|nr:large subunit ribosomal protein [Rickettsiaceae bacterium]